MALKSGNYAEVSEAGPGKCYNRHPVLWVAEENITFNAIAAVIGKPTEKKETETKTNDTNL